MPALADAVRITISRITPIVHLNATKTGWFNLESDRLGYPHNSCTPDLLGFLIGELLKTAQINCLRSLGHIRSVRQGDSPKDQR